MQFCQSDLPHWFETLMIPFVLKQIRYSDDDDYNCWRLQNVCLQLFLPFPVAIVVVISLYLVKLGSFQFERKKSSLLNVRHLALKILICKSIFLQILNYSFTAKILTISRVSTIYLRKKVNSDHLYPRQNIIKIDRDWCSNLGRTGTHPIHLWHAWWLKRLRCHFHTKKLVSIGIRTYGLSLCSYYKSIHCVKAS